MDLGMGSLGYAEVIVYVIAGLVLIWSIGSNRALHKIYADTLSAIKESYETQIAKTKEITQKYNAEVAEIHARTVNDIMLEIANHNSVRVTLLHTYLEQELNKDEIDVEAIKDYTTKLFDDRGLIKEVSERTKVIIDSQKGKNNV